MRNVTALPLDISRLFGHANVVLNVTLLEQFVFKHHRSKKDCGREKHHHHSDPVGQGRWKCTAKIDGSHGCKLLRHDASRHTVKVDFNP